jgi:hypothetical protein
MPRLSSGWIILENEIFVYGTFPGSFISAHDYNMFTCCVFIFVQYTYRTALSSLSLFVMSYGVPVYAPGQLSAGGLSINTRLMLFPPQVHTGTHIHMYTHKPLHFQQDVCVCVTGGVEGAACLVPAETPRAPRHDGRLLAVPVTTKTERHHHVHTAGLLRLPPTPGEHLQYLLTLRKYTVAASVSQ